MQSASRAGFTRCLTNARLSDTSVVRIFCCPHAGDIGASYANWKALFPPAFDVCPVVLPGRATRAGEQLARRLDVVVASLSDELQGLLDRPFVLFGHSLGALVAYELACELSLHAALEPVALFVSGRRPPGMPPRHGPMHALTEPEFTVALRACNGTPEEVLRSPEFAQVFAPVLRADLEINETYRHERRVTLSCPIVAFCGDGDTFATPDDMDAWAHVTRGPFALHVLSGDHFFIRAGASAVAALMTEYVQRFVLDDDAGSSR